MGRLLREVEGVLNVEGVLLGEGVVLVEPLGRLTEVAAVYLHVVEDRQEALDVFVDPGEHSTREVLGRTLDDTVLRYHRRHRENTRVRGCHRCAPLSPPATGPRGCCSNSVSGTVQVLRKTYWEGRLRWLLVQSIVGRRFSSGREPRR